MSKRKSRKSNSNKLIDVTWQFVGMITIVVLMALVVFGNSYDESNVSNKSLLEKSYSQAIAEFDWKYKSN